MRLKPQYVVIIAIVVVLVAYFGIRSLFGGRGGEAEAKPPAANALPSVQAKLTPESIREAQVVMRGRTEAARSVVVRSETAGVVAATPTPEGSFVRQGQVLCRLAVDARQASLDQARAALKSRQLQRQAAQQLREKGFRSETQVLEAFDRRDAEIGTYLAPGQPCGTMIELNPLLVVGDAPETEAARLRSGAPAQARLVDGTVLNGRVRYVARDADPQTRTYHLEVAVPNPGNTVRSGLSADLRIAAGAGPAHLVPVSALVLDSAGRQGVRYVQPGGRVGFAPVTVLEETSQGMWVSGLKGSVNVITVGQSFVADGQKVRVAQAR